MTNALRVAPPQFMPAHAVFFNTFAVRCSRNLCSPCCPWPRPVTQARKNQAFQPCRRLAAVRTFTVMMVVNCAVAILLITRPCIGAKRKITSFSPSLPVGCILFPSFRSVGCSEGTEGDKVVSKPCFPARHGPAKTCQRADHRWVQPPIGTIISGWVRKFKDLANPFTAPRCVFSLQESKISGCTHQFPGDSITPGAWPSDTMQLNEADSYRCASLQASSCCQGQGVS